jgi:hypothetical protein
MADRAPDGMANLTPGEHLVHAHAHTTSAGVHADLAAAHVKAAHDGAPDGAGGDAGWPQPACFHHPAAGRVRAEQNWSSPNWVRAEQNWFFCRFWCGPGVPRGHEAQVNVAQRADFLRGRGNHDPGRLSR